MKSVIKGPAPACPIENVRRVKHEEELGIKPETPNPSAYPSVGTVRLGLADLKIG